ncbi:MAG TPA: hypothetical protein VK302_11015 [Terriglobales bacterium]|nr:hypothetical protein [Terriglobales bacterium]
MPDEEAGEARCDKHKTRMVKVRVKFTDIATEETALRCCEPDCTRYFTDGLGYLDVLDGRRLAEKFQQRCPKCKTPMYLSETEQETEIWRCTTPKCEHEQRIVG